MGNINVLPVNDKHVHKEDEFCMCNPQIEKHDGNKIVIHNAFDGREFNEALANAKELG